MATDFTRIFTAQSGVHGTDGWFSQGIENLLVLRGDDPKGGDQPDAKPVFDYESLDLLALARDLRDKQALPSGRKVEPAPTFFIGGADVPKRPDDKWSPVGLQKKIDAGADFVQTNYIFDVALFRRFMDRVTDMGLDAIRLGCVPSDRHHPAHRDPVHPRRAARRSAESAVDTLASLRARVARATCRDDRAAPRDRFPTVPA